MLLAVLSLAWSAAADFSWKGTEGALLLHPDSEEHLGDAPVFFRMTQAGNVHTWSTPTLPAPIPVEKGPVQLQLQLSLCSNDGSRCRMLELQGEGEVTGRKGSILLSESHTPQLVAAQPGQAVRLLDFTAVWCPPCNLMSAQMLEDPTEAGLLAPFSVERVDVDRPESWALKSRYQVGGYPTLIAVDAEGNEVDRQVGYPGEEQMRGWLQGLPSARPLSELMSLPALSPQEAAVAARRLAQAQAEKPALHYLETAQDGPDFRMARLLLQPSPEDARWLLSHHVPAGDWLYTAIEQAPDQKEILEYLATGPDPAGYLQVLAESSKEPELLQVAALRLLEAQRTGDLEKDRGLITDLADLYAQTNQLDKAEALLHQAIARWPEEFTWHYVLGRLRLDAEQLPGAEAEARDALRCAYGDQQLRAAMLLAKVLRAENRSTEGIAILDQALLAIPEPPPELQVRTSRYRKQAQELRAELASPPTPR